MKQTSKKMNLIVGWILFILSIGIFFLQIGFLFFHERLQFEYIDNRLFYVLNMIFVICLFIAILLLLNLEKKWKVFGAVVLLLFMIPNITMISQTNKEIKNIISVSPNFQHVLSLKENTKTGETYYYRSYFGILGRPKEKLPYQTNDRFKVDWLTDDIAAVTYKAKDKTVHQYIGTYGDRGTGISYYYVAAQIYGVWEGENARITNETEGLSVTVNGKTEIYKWDQVVQFGTLAIVLMKNNEAVWTVALNKDFNVEAEEKGETPGTILLYKATMGKTEPILLKRVSSSM
ncbi:hypothetical protein NST17_04580 [Caldifermentibacillus hisashii]|uniref:Uncharacterized protein n=1 Tax=Caldifermentibacillus hisashii TaxID=996558 RepID=A0ABU9JUF5_9BACI